MNKSIVVLLLLSFGSGIVAAQDRPRRVGSQSGTQTQTRQTTPQAGSPQTQPSQTRPPVLGGANYPNNRQPSPVKDPVQEGPEEVDAGDVIRVNTTLVTIPVSVMDRDGRYVPNLGKQDFRLWEDGVEQDVAFFASVDKPFSVVLMLDTSPSTKFRMDEIQDAAISFINQLRPDDKVMVVEFNDHINILSELTGDRRKLERAIRRAHTGDGTRLYDAVDMVINQQLSRIQGRKAIVLFTDGVDTTSKHANFQSNVMDAQELDALIYPVQYDTSADVGSTGGSNYPSSTADVLGQIIGGIFGGKSRNNRRGNGGGYPGGGNSRGGGGYPGRRGPGGGEYAIAEQYLREMAESSGGREYKADSLQNMSYAFGNVAEELRRQYSIGYYPKRPAQAGQRRQIRVRANQPNLAVRSRETYIFNPNGGVVVDNDTRNNPPVLKKLVDRERSVSRLR